MIDIISEIYHSEERLKQDHRKTHSWEFIFSKGVKSHRSPDKNDCLYIIFDVKFKVRIFKIDVNDKLYLSLEKGNRNN